jgi:hypothetical protein
MAVRRTRKNKRNLNKTRKYKKQGKKHHRGGQNIGANSCDPNFSIYNTNFLKLFPYKV